jgi:uncharacterized protein
MKPARFTCGGAAIKYALDSMHRIRNLVGLLLAFAFLAGVPIAYAQRSYPEPTDLYVNDFAGLLTGQHAEQIRAWFADLKRETGVEAVAVTIDSIGDYNTGDTTIESFATHLFNVWGVGDKEKNNGVMILVAMRDRKVRIEVGAGYESTLNAAMQEVINEHMLPAFRRNDYSQGIYDGARAMIQKLTGKWPEGAAAAPVASAPGATRATVASPPRSNAGLEAGILTIVGATVAVGAAAFGLPRYARYRRRRCPNCGTFMTRLDEVSDDVYLNSGQKAEELLHSVDYDVWKCPRCNRHTLHGYNRWLSGFKPCPRCGFRTLSSTRTTLSAPTYTSQGQDRVSRDCRNCPYHDEQIVVVPMLVQSSSSSDSSASGGFSSSSSGDFGGGTSSGDGASGSW